MNVIRQLFFFIGSGMLFYCILIACSTEETRLEEIQIIPDKKIDRFSDTILFTHRMEYMSSNEQYLCLPNVSEGTFFILDLDLNPVSTIGNKGKGPTDFMHPYISFFLKQDLLLFDIVNKKIVPTNWKNFEVGTPYNWIPNRSFGRITCDEEKNIIVHDFKGEFPLMKYSKNGELLQEFGTFFKYDDEKHKRAMNNFHLLENKAKELYAISYDKPIIQKFDATGTKIFVEDLTNLFQYYVDNNKKLVADKEAYKYTIWNLYKDAAIHGNKIYLLYWSNEEFQQFYPNIRQTIFQVLELEDNGNALIPQKIYNLALPLDQEEDLRMFSTITVQGNALFAFDKRSRTLYRYQLN
jgi:hypothetical protein